MAESADEPADTWPVPARDRPGVPISTASDEADRTPRATAISRAPRTPVLDPLTTVIGRHGVRYACPDMTALDRHLVELRERIRHATPRFPQLVGDFRDEIDLLLDRRRWLKLVA